MLITQSSHNNWYRNGGPVTEIESVFNNTIDKLIAMKTITSDECPRDLDINIVGKSEKCLAIADYVLGAIRFYLTKGLV
jgi:hypothetical protein